MSDGYKPLRDLDLRPGDVVEMGSMGKLIVGPKGKMLRRVDGFKMSLKINPDTLARIVSRAVVPVEAPPDWARWINVYHNGTGILNTSRQYADMAADQSPPRLAVYRLERRGDVLTLVREDL